MNQKEAVTGGAREGAVTTDWDKLRDKSGEQGTSTTWDDLRGEEYRGDARVEKVVAEQSGASTENEAEEPVAETGLAAQRLAVMEAAKETKRPVSEMEPGVIAQEYLGILRSLGENFSSPEGKSARLVRADGSVAERGYSGDKEFVERIYGLGGMKGEESVEDLDKALNLRMVDSILEGEQRWRDAGEEHAAAQETITKANERLDQLKKEGKSMGLLGKIRTFGARHKEKKELQAKISTAQMTMRRMEMKTKKSNEKLNQSLRAAYSEDYHYGNHQESTEHQNDQKYMEQTSAEYNQRFMEGHEEEIARAIELRKALLKMKHGKLQSERPMIDDQYDSL